MSWKKIIKSKKILWHNHFIPSLFAGLLVALISFIYETTTSNIILFASIGASAVILTNSKSHHLTKLYPVILSYLVAVIFSSIIYLLNKSFVLPIQINLFILVFITGLLLYLLNIFHPPAITASISFILLERPLGDLGWLFLAIILLLTFWRFLVYLFIQKLSIKEFKQEFGKEFKKKISL